MERQSKKQGTSVGSEARSAFSAAFDAVLKLNATNPTAVAAAMKKRKGSRKTPAQKTLANMLNGAHPHQVGNMEAVAEFFNIPLWMMLTPGMNPKLLQNPYKDRLKKLMADYFACNSEGRTAVENMAAGHAALRQIERQKGDD